MISIEVVNFAKSGEEIQGKGSVTSWPPGEEPGREGFETVQNEPISGVDVPSEEKPIETGMADGSLLGSELGNDWLLLWGCGPLKPERRQKTGRQ